jgi:hypothetical protein
LEFVKILIIITVNIFKHTAKKIRKLNEQIKFFLKCMVGEYQSAKPDLIRGVALDSRGGFTVDFKLVFNMA